MDQRMTPLRRQTFHNASFQSPRGSFIPMRRQSMITSTPMNQPESANDDEAERRVRQRKSIVENEEIEQNKVASLPLSAMEEYIASCIRLSDENKINSKNVWKIHIIDYLKTLIDKGTENPLQIASASLGVSAKVYGIRVDSVHTDVLKLAGELNRLGHTDKIVNDEHENGENIDSENPQNSQAEPKAKRRKKTKKSTLANPESLLGKPDLLEIQHPLFAELNARAGDINSSENLLQTFIPMDRRTGEMVVTQNNKFFDGSEIEIPHENEKNRKVNLPCNLVRPEDLKACEICPPFSNYQLTDWSPEEEELRLTQQLQKESSLTRQEALVLAFDMDAEPLPIGDITAPNDHAGMDTSDEEIVEQDGQQGMGFRPIIENIVDMRPSNPSLTRNLEYSYNSTMSGIWAGPAHWKFKPIKIRTQPSFNPADPNAVPQKRKKQRRDVDIIYQEAINEKPFLKTCESRLKRATILAWDVEKNVLPADMHISPVEQMTFITNPKKSLMPLLTASRPQTRQSLEPPNTEYNYDNLNDSNFCTSNMGNDLHHNDDDVDVDHRKSDDENEGLVGLDMIEAPTKVPQIYVPYAMRAKKVDMKRIKNSVKEIIFEHENGEINANEVKSDMTFSKVYKHVPLLLPRDQAENVSPALVFFSLLHVTNEENLTLEGQPDLSDLKILKNV